MPKNISRGTRKKTLQQRIRAMPIGPGVYRWLDRKRNVLYVGKAKNLRRRLQSYLGKKSNDGPWRRALSDSIADVDVTLTPSEREALVLETNLIKELQPKYNVLMKDGKNYLYARITSSDPFPRVNLVRHLEKDRAEYFGPYLTKESIEHILAMLHELFTFRACKRSLDRLNKDPGTAVTTAVPCLEHQIGRCCGLCTGAVHREEYRRRIGQVIRFLRGNHEKARTLLKTRMKTAAGERKFERAATLRNFLAILDGTPRGGILVSDTSEEDSDIFGIATHTGHVHVVLLPQRHGRIVGDVHFALTGSAENAAQVLEQFLPQYYGEHRDIPPTILLPTDFEGRATLTQWLSAVRGRRVNIHIPERGRKSRLLQLAEKNALDKAEQAAREWEQKQKNTSAALQGLQKALGLLHPPHRIEAYDISHLSGTETVGSMVVALNGQAANNHYRSFTIRTLREGAIDDYKALQEILQRRLRYLQEQKKKPRKGKRQRQDSSLPSTPDLLVIDGGKGQLSVALDVLGESQLTIPVVAIAKREEEVFVAGKSTPLSLPEPEKLLLMRLRDEAHRFANRHRERRLRHRLLRS